MDFFGIAGIPTLVVLDAQGTVITTSGRRAVDQNPEGCVAEWEQGKSGAPTGTGIPWGSWIFYGLVIGLFIWLVSGPGEKDRVSVE
jgi:hypothetical protein